MNKNLIKKLTPIIKEKLGFNSIKEIKSLGGGLSESRNYKIILEGHKPLFVKIFPQSYKKRIKKEENTLRLLRNTKIPSPNLIYIDYEFDDERGILIQGYIAGTSLKNNLLKKNPFNKKSLEEAGRVIAKLHKSSFAERWQDLESNIKSKDEWIERKVKQRNDSNIKDLRRFGILSNEKIEKLEKYLDNFEKKLYYYNFRLCALHGDYNLENIMVKDGKVKGILDFEQHHVGHNLSDLGIAYYWFKFEGFEELFPIFLKGYKTEFKEVRNMMNILYGYYIMQVIGAISFLSKNNSSKKALNRLKNMLKEFVISFN